MSTTAAEMSATAAHATSTLATAGATTMLGDGYPTRVRDRVGDGRLAELSRCLLAESSPAKLHRTPGEPDRHIASHPYRRVHSN
jgi:hypothetical protein